MSSFLQSPEWETFQKAAGALTCRTGELLWLQRSIPSIGKYWISSRCQVPDEFSPKSPLAGGFFLRVEPENEESFKNLQKIAADQKLSLVPTAAVQPRQTIIVDINKSYEEVLQSMKQKHRYNTRIAERHGVTVVEAPGEFARFWKLMQETARRQGFRLHPREYYAKMIHTLSSSGMVRLLFAQHEGDDLATMLLVVYGNTATYLHGASTEAHRELMAPYLLHAQAIQLAQKTGCTFYDLWGSNLIKDPHTNEWKAQEHHPSYGTSRFKLGFGGEVINYPGTYDLILNPFCYTLYNGVRNLRRGHHRAFS